MVPLVVLTIVFFLSVILDAVSTRFAIDNGAVESNPFVVDPSNIWGLIVSMIKFFIVGGFLYAISSYLSIGFLQSTIILVFWTVSLAKLHASMENFLLGAVDFSPSNSLRRLLRAATPTQHVMFNMVYFGVPSVWIVFRFIKPEVVTV